MSNLARAARMDDHVRMLTGAALNEAIARELRYRLGRELPAESRTAFPDAQYDHAWFTCELNKTWHPISPESIDFAERLTLVKTLPLPSPTPQREDWIHVEFGPEARWVVRLLRFTRLPVSPTPRWEASELYRADRDDDPISLPTAYGQAWLLSRLTWPERRTEPHHAIRTVSRR